MILQLNESKFRNMLTEMVKEVLLLEADNRIKTAINGCTPYLKKFGDTEEQIKSAFRNFRMDFYGEGLMGNDKLKTLILAPMFCKFAVENGWTPTSGVITEVKKILFEIVNHHGEDIPELVNKFNNNPNEITWSFIHDKYQPFIDKRQEEENARISQNQYTKDNRYNYKIYGPLTFEQAKKFGKHSKPNGEICYTQKKGTWNLPSYTNNNNRKVYVLVLSNWKDIPCEHTPDGYFTHTTDGDPIPADDNGYDLYGMSMIFLIVDKLGNLVVSNTRWNHGGSGRGSDIDNMFTKEDIYKLIGSEKANEIFNTPYKSIQDALNKGVSIKELFNDWEDIGNGYIKVCIGYKWTILDNNKQIIYKPNNPEQWFDKVYDINKNGIATVKLNDKWTWFSLEKQDYLFQNKWFDFAHNFNDNGIAVVELNGKMTWVSLEKEDYLFQDKWFEYVNNFYNGIAEVKLNGKWNWFSLEKQELLSPNLCFDKNEKFNTNGIAKVKLNGKWNWFDKNKGGLVWDKPIEKWFDWVGEFRYSGIAVVQLNDQWNWFSLEKQELLSPNLCFDWFDDFNSNGIPKVQLNGKYNWFDKNKGGLVWDKPIEQWFDGVGDFDKNGIAVVELNGKMTWVSLEKQDYLFPNLWFDRVGDFYNGIAFVKLNGEKYYFTLDGQFLDHNTKQPLSDEELQSLQKQQQIDEMVNRLVRNYRKY